MFCSLAELRAIFSLRDIVLCSFYYAAKILDEKKTFFSSE